MTRRSAAAALVLGAAALWVVQLLWASRGYVPIWDGRVYADCVVRAATQSFTIEALRCADHPTQAYVGLLGLVQRLAPGNMPLMLATNALLLALGAIAFARLLRAAFPDRSLALERTLLVAALVVDPVVVASMIQINVDFGVLVFLLCATAAMVEDRRGLVIVFGLLTAFSKETGALLYAGLLVAWWLAEVLPQPMSRRVRNALLAALLVFAAGMLLLPWAVWTVPAVAAFAALTARGAYERPFDAAALRTAVRRLAALAPLGVPLVVYAAYLAGRPLLLPRTNVLWGDRSGGELVRLVLFPQLAPIARDYLALIFVVNFHWILASVLAAAMILGAARHARWRPRTPVPNANDPLVRFAVLALVIETYLITRVPTAVNARYMIPVYPVVFVAALAGVLRLRVPPGARRVLLGALPVLLALSARHTIDPVSRALWGTIPVGRRDVLHIKSLVRPYSGSYGRDETVYNLEMLTAMPPLIQAALDRLHPVQRRVLVTGEDGDWHIVGPVDARSQRRLVGRGLVAPIVVEAPGLATADVLLDSAWYLELPYVKNGPSLRALERRYTIGAPDTLWADGYAVALRRLDRRPAVAQATASGAVGTP